MKKAVFVPLQALKTGHSLKGNAEVETIFEAHGSATWRGWNISGKPEDRFL